MIFWGVILNHHLVFFLPLHQILLHLLANILLGFPYAPLQDKAFRVCFVLHWVEPGLKSFHNVYNLLFNSSLNHCRILHATCVDHIPWRIIEFAHFSVQIDNVTRCERLLPASLKFLFNFVSERLAASFWKSWAFLWISGAGSKGSLCWRPVIAWIPFARNRG